ncbi:MAG: YihA family ribosome biogenesis GTP-binding protein [Flavobacteriaceae bacterium TMED179]|nr:MAG: YihA family ribosome biogenesis GTP-binding protein [Flavobacteriaceae bacterium TMED179]|tara:strand:+ start:79858 stop:80475 length:618 start_codon:yes stop_codon:yes gene_type:complete
MQIKSARFVISNTEVAKCPKNSFPEYAFIGRSNVGKSSLINSICNKKKLAKISSKPGKTQLINHFLINENWYLVDLPGYGYARVSKTRKKIFQEFIIDYLKKRSQLVNTFLLIDIRHEPQDIDLRFMEWLVENLIPFSIVFTKSDKLKPRKISNNINLYMDQMLSSNWAELPPIFKTSSNHQTGVEEILIYINKLNRVVLENNQK